MKRAFNRLCLASVFVLVVGAGIVALGEFRRFSWTWGGSRPHFATHELLLSGGELCYDWRDEGPSPSPAPAWRGDEACDYDVRLFLLRYFRMRETWYLGERAFHMLPEERKLLPHFLHFRRSIRIDFGHIAIISLIPLTIWLITNRQRFHWPRWPPE